MQSFFEWFHKTSQDRDKPWLILGKGPSFSKRDQFDVGRFHLLSLNHAVREQSVKVAHAIDYDVVEACGEAIDKNAEVLVLPWYPHRQNRPGNETLGELARKNVLLRGLAEQGRLLWYNHSLAPRFRDDSPVVPVRFFSSEAVLNLLATAGVCQVRSLGIDGGTDYSIQFQDLRGRTLLSNGWPSFDIQFAEIAKILFRTGLDYAPLDVESPIRVYVATTEAQMLAVKVLEFSIRKHASMSVRIYPLHLAGIPIPTPSRPEHRPRTPFSFQRFLIPALTGYEGKAIYLDSDMQVFRDIRNLWTRDFEEADLLTVREPEATGRRPQFSVMLLNCGALRWDIRAIVQLLDQGKISYEELMYDMTVAKSIRASIDPAWNSLERYDERETALVHYTDMNTQPWLSRANALGYLWVKDLIEALDTRFLSLAEVIEHVQRGFVRPSLLYQVEHQILDSFRLPKRARELDKSFVSPFGSAHSHCARPWQSPASYLRGVARSYLQSSRLLRVHRRVKSLLTRS